MKINWSTFNYNYAAVEPTFLSAIDFLTNGTVNRIICDDDRINCNFFSSVIFIKFRTDSIYIFVQYISQTKYGYFFTSKEKIIKILSDFFIRIIIQTSNCQLLNISHLNEIRSNLPMQSPVLEMKTEKFTGPNKALLVLGQRTGAHREDWVTSVRQSPVLKGHLFLVLP
jgi:hypothetical protein